MKIRTGFLLSTFVVFSSAAAFAQGGLSIDPFPLEGDGGGVVKPQISQGKISERIPAEQVRRVGDTTVRVISNAPELAAKVKNIAVPPPALTPQPLSSEAINVKSQASHQLAETRTDSVLPGPIALVNPSLSRVAQPVVASPRHDGSGLVRIPVPDWAQLYMRKAEQGESLESVLRGWSAREGVELIWRSPHDFLVPQAMQGNASYEASVRGLLDQYQGQAQRPVASLHVDTQTGLRTLLVRIEG